MRVVATAVGHDGRAIRQPGDEFEMPDTARGSWFHPAGDELKDPSPAPVARKRKPAAQPAEGGDLA